MGLCHPSDLCWVLLTSQHILVSTCHWSQPVSLQLIQGKMAEMYTTLNCSRSYLYNVARALDDGQIVAKVGGLPRLLLRQSQCHPQLEVSQFIHCVCLSVGLCRCHHVHCWGCHKSSTGCCPNTRSVYSSVKVLRAPCPNTRPEYPCVKVLRMPCPNTRSVYFTHYSLDTKSVSQRGVVRSTRGSSCLPHAAISFCLYWIDLYCKTWKGHSWQVKSVCVLCRWQWLHQWLPRWPSTERCETLWDWGWYHWGSQASHRTQYKCRVFCTTGIGMHC